MSDAAEQPENSIARISDVNARLRALVESETLDKPFWIGGVVRGLYVSDRGHLYFNLYDDEHSISCIVFETSRGTLDFSLNNGMEIEAMGVVRVYEKQARMQIEVLEARLIQRPLFVPDMSVWEQLEKRGLWPRERRELPEHIGEIALITSRYTDAERDFHATYRREGGTAAVNTVDVRIQGQQAPREIADAINRVNQDGGSDVIALVRGGGRVKEIAVFDDYLILEAICRSYIPVVTGIGHEPHTTLADRVADVMTITPTAAASHLARLSQAFAPQTAEPPSQATRTRLSPALIAALVVIVVLVFLLVMQGQ